MLPQPPTFPSSTSPHLVFVTLFPEIIELWLRTSILGRAHAAGLFTYAAMDLRPFGLGRHRAVDDVAYGGGGGMVFRPEPLVAALETAKAAAPDRTWTVLCPSASGRPLTQPWLRQIAAQPAPQGRGYLFICGHYEGIDQRFFDGWVDVEFSAGDFVVTGGELPALLCADALLRLEEGTVPHEGGVETESFSLTSPDGELLLEYPQYTRPREFLGREVPEVLLSGDHGAIAAWRSAQSQERTRLRRPDLAKRSRSPLFDNAPTKS